MKAPALATLAVIWSLGCSSTSEPVVPPEADATTDAVGEVADTRDSGLPDVCVGPQAGSTEPGCGGYIKGHTCTGCACAPGYYCSAVPDGGTEGVCCADGACGATCKDDCDCRSHLCGTDGRCR